MDTGTGVDTNSSVGSISVWISSTGMDTSIGLSAVGGDGIGSIVVGLIVKNSNEIGLSMSSASVGLRLGASVAGFSVCTFSVGKGVGGGDGGIVGFRVVGLRVGGDVFGRHDVYAKHVIPSIRAAPSFCPITCHTSVTLGEIHSMENQCYGCYHTYSCSPYPGPICKARGTSERPPNSEVKEEEQ